MTLSLAVWDFVVIGLMLAVSASVGIYFRFTGGKQKTTQEFLMAGKDMSIWPVAFSLMATYMSAISVLGIPSETYKFGAQFVMWIVGMPFGILVAAYVFLPVFFSMNVSTAYEYLEKRFGKITRSVVSVLFILQMILYMAVVLYAPSLALNAVTGLSTWASVVTMAVVCTFYCSLGGLKAVLWTDVFQSLLMYVAIIAVVVKASIDVGGFGRSFDIANDGGRLIFFEPSVDLVTRYTLLNSIITGITFSTNTFGTNQAQVQRLMSVKSLSRAKKALWLSMPLIIIFNIFCCWDGLVIYSLFHDCDPMLQPGDSPLTSADQLLPYAVLKMFSHIPGFCGLCVAGIFSASLSTISSAVNSLTAVTVEDFMKPYCQCRRVTDAWATFMAKIIAICYGGLCLVLTYMVSNFRGVLEASNVLFGLVGGPVLGLFCNGMLTTTANQEGSLIGLLAGFCFSGWMGFGSYVANIKIPDLPRSIEGCPVTQNVSMDAMMLPLNESMFNEFSNSNSSEKDAYETYDDVFPLYKISFMWFPAMSALTSLVVGYIASYIIGCCRKQKPVSPEVISPVIRKWISKVDFYRGKDVPETKLQKIKSHSNGLENGKQKSQLEAAQNGTCSNTQTHL